MKELRFYVYALWSRGRAQKVGKGSGGRAKFSRHESGAEFVEIVERFDSEAHAYAREAYWREALKTTGCKHIIGKWITPKPENWREEIDRLQDVPGYPSEHTNRYLHYIKSGIWLRPADHDTIRDAAEKLREEREAE